METFFGKLFSKFEPPAKCDILIVPLIFYHQKNGHEQPERVSRRHRSILREPTVGADLGPDLVEDFVVDLVEDFVARLVDDISKCSPSDSFPVPKKAPRLSRIATLFKQAFFFASNPVAAYVANVKARLYSDFLVLPS